MAESMNGLKRSHRCGELSLSNVGETVTVMGWVAKQRNKGGIIFVDLRDRSGILQVIFEESDAGAEGFAKAEKLRSEYVVAVVGEPVLLMRTWLQVKSKSGHPRCVFFRKR